MSIVVLNGQRISSEKIKKAGVNFLYEDLKTALSNCLP
jgi:NAD dependent epimerase/dehydratase family enzyme